jgi:hypothetical protein
MTTDVWCVYVDRTDDGRAFYVGKGNASRVRDLNRNTKHGWVSRHHGIYREVVLETRDEGFAFQHEEELIAKLHTFIDDHLADSVVCNFTRGGDGGKHSEETRAKIGAAKRGKLLAFEDQPEEVGTVDAYEGNYLYIVTVDQAHRGTHLYGSAAQPDEIDSYFATGGGCRWVNAGTTHQSGARSPVKQQWRDALQWR